MRKERKQVQGARSAEATIERRFLLALAEGLQRYGAGAARVEELLDGVAARLRVQARVFSTPTALMVTFDDAEDARTALLKVPPAEIDLDRLVSLEAVARDAIGGKLKAREGLVRVRAICLGGALYRRGLGMLASAGAAGAAAPFFGGGWREALVAGLTGLAVGLSGQWYARRPGAAATFDFTAAAVATIAALLLSRWLEPFQPRIAIMAGLVFLLPGYTVTVALGELTSGHLISGTTRLLRGMMALMALGFGVALGGQIVGWEPTSAAAPAPLPGWLEPPLLALTALSYVVLFHAPWRDARGIVLAGAAAVWGARAGALLLGPQLGAFVGAFGVGALSHLYARRTGRPPAVLMLPGVMMLVPGSVGFRSVSAFLEGKALAGLEAAFSMVLVAMSLVAGLLLATQTFGRPAPHHSPDPAPSDTAGQAAG